MPVILPNETDIYAVTDADLSLSQGRSLEELARALLGSGIKILQYREKKMKDRAMLEECRLLRRITKEYNACFIVDDHVDLALLSQADGIHVGQEDIPLRDVRSLVGDMCIGISALTPAQALEAEQGGADYIGIGPIFSTQTKADAGEALGLGFVDWVVANIKIPFVCIGGIKAHNVHELVQHGGYCSAIISELVCAPDIPDMVLKIRHAMR